VAETHLNLVFKNFHGVTGKEEKKNQISHILEGESNPASSEHEALGLTTTLRRWV